MKNTIKEKFKNNVLVKPLYKLKNRNKIEPGIIVSVDRTIELDGHGVNVKKDVVHHSGKVLKSKDINKRKKVFLCNECESYDKVILSETVQQKRNGNRNGIRRSKMLDVIENTNTNSINADRVVNAEVKTSKFIPADDNLDVQQTACTWLRLYPLPKLPEESTCSVIFRCMLCQLGLATILVLWTCVWTFVIHSLESPYELKISMDFEKAQNQLVIDLATELRQIAIRHFNVPTTDILASSLTPYYHLPSYSTRHDQIVFYWYHSIAIGRPFPVMSQIAKSSHGDCIIRHKRNSFNVCLSIPWLEVDHCVAQFLTGHGNFKHKLLSFNLVESPLCQCLKIVEQSAHHVLLECCLYQTQRMNLI